MNGLKVLMLFALLTFPLAATAQTVHISADPDPQTERCQNHTAAFHANGDVVMVEYHGQWRELDDGRRVQNGGIEGRSCEVERVLRLTPERKVVWEIRPSHKRSEHGFARQDKITGMTATPDGGTVVALYDGLVPEQSHSTLLYVEKDGELRWRLRTEQAPKFSMLTPHVGPNGALFVEVSATNYGYEGGAFQLPGSTRTKLRANQNLASIARIDRADGRVLWERFGMMIADISADSVITLDETFTRKPTPKSRYVIRKLSYEGTVVAEGTTPWLDGETILSAAYDGEHLFMTTRREHLNPGGRGVERRTSNLRVFDMDGTLVHTRGLSDGSILADREDGAPMRIVSPANCTRGLAPYRCVTDALDVITLENWDDEGTPSRLKFPRGGLVEHEQFEAKSTASGLWVSARTYYGSDANDAHHPESVTAVYSPDDMRTPVETPQRFVWKPKPRKKTPSRTMMLTF